MTFCFAIHNLLLIKTSSFELQLILENEEKSKLLQTNW